MKPHRIHQWVAVGCAVAGVYLASRPIFAQQKPRLNPLIARVQQGQAALSGTDWMFIDMEHGPYLLEPRVGRDRERPPLWATKTRRARRI
jgi:hypothetical protein